jgi:hypothetical protein
LCSMVSKCELLINVVMSNKPKALSGLAKRHADCCHVHTSGHTDQRLSAKRQNLTCACPLYGTQ